MRMRRQYTTRRNHGRRTRVHRASYALTRSSSSRSLSLSYRTRTVRTLQPYNHTHVPTSTTRTKPVHSNVTRAKVSANTNAQILHIRVRSRLHRISHAMSSSFYYQTLACARFYSTYHREGSSSAILRAQTSRECRYITRPAKLACSIPTAAFAICSTNTQRLKCNARKFP